MDKIIELFNNGLQSNLIANILNLDKLKIEIILLDNFYKLHPRTKINKDIIQLAIINRYNNISFEKSAKILNISNASICNILKKSGIYFLNFAYKDKSILTNKNINTIINLFNNGCTIKLISEKYNLNVDIISKLLKNNNINTQKITFNYKIFDEIDTEEKAYWLGFLYADGSVSSNRNTIEISLKSEDIEHLYKFKQFTNSEYLPSLNITNKYNRCRICISNLHTKNSLIKLGCVPNKSLILKFPDKSYFKYDYLIKDFIRGYFDGDGTISYNLTNPKLHEKITISCSLLGTKDFLFDLKQYLLLFDIKTSNIYLLKSNIHAISFSKKNSVKFCNLIYDNSSIYLNRKYERYAFFKLNNFAVHKSDFMNNDRAISVNAKNWIENNKDNYCLIHANTEITKETKESLVS